MGNMIIPGENLLITNETVGTYVIPDNYYYITFSLCASGGKSDIENKNGGGSSSYIKYSTYTKILYNGEIYILKKINYDLLSVSSVFLIFVDSKNEEYVINLISNSGKNNIGGLFSTIGTDVPWFLLSDESNVFSNGVDGGVTIDGKSENGKGESGRFLR